MSRHSADLYLYHIREACKAIRQFAANRALDDYIADPMLRSAIERQFMIIGEALNKALRIEPQLLEAITSASNIVRLRHRLAQGYFDIDDDIIWGIVEVHPPTLLAEVSKLLDARDASQ